MEVDMLPKVYKTNAAKRRLEREREKDHYEEEVMLAHAFLQACPELTYGEALGHAHAKLRKEKGYYKQQPNR
jgi:hypothetical protein